MSSGTGIREVFACEFPRKNFFRLYRYGPGTGVGRGRGVGIARGAIVPVGVTVTVAAANSSTNRRRRNRFAPKLYVEVMRSFRRRSGRGVFCHSVTEGAKEACVWLSQTNMHIIAEPCRAQDRAGHPARFAVPDHKISQNPDGVAAIGTSTAPGKRDADFEIRVGR